MSEERFDRMEQKLDELVVGQAELRANVSGLQSKVANLQTNAAEFRVGQAELKTGQDDLRREMRVLHEQLIDNIKAIPDPSPQLERMMDQKIAGLREEIGQRLDPLEAVVKLHFGT